MRRGGKGKEKETGGGERAMREGTGSLGRGKKGGRGNGGDKFPAWSSRDLGSTSALMKLNINYIINYTSVCLYVCLHRFSVFHCLHVCI